MRVDFDWLKRVIVKERQGGTFGHDARHAANAVVDESQQPGCLVS